MSNTYSGSPVTVIGTGVNITTGAVSASATIPLDQAGNSPRYIRVAATAACYVRIDKTSATAVSTDMLIQPADAVIMHVPSGYTKIAGIQTVAAGVLQVSPLENC